MWYKKKQSSSPAPKALSDEERERYKDEHLRLTIEDLRKKRGLAFWATVIGGIVVAVGGIATLAIQAWQHRIEMREHRRSTITENITKLVLALGDSNSQVKLAAIMALDFYVERDEYREFHEGLGKVVGELVNIEGNLTVKDKLVSVATKLRGKGREVAIVLPQEIRKEIEEIRVAQAQIKTKEPAAVESPAESTAASSKIETPKGTEVTTAKVPKELEAKIIALGKKGIVGLDLSRQDLSGLDLTAANLKLANLEETSLRGAVLKDADLSGARLKDADLAGANLRDADLSGADLTRARLVQTDLSSANFKGANLLEADLTGANLMWASFFGADLYNANLKDVRNFNTLSFGRLSGALLEGVKGLSRDDIDFAISNGAITEGHKFFMQQQAR